MGKIKDLVEAAKHNDTAAMLEIIEMFSPKIRKYTRIMGNDEDFKSDVVLSLIEMVHSINLDKLENDNDYVLVSYISKTIYHKYINLAQKHGKITDAESTYENESEFEQACYTPSAPKFSDDIELLDFLKKSLTARELFCVQMIVLQGYSATEVAAMTGVTKQAVNQCKKRALVKLKEQL